MTEPSETFASRLAAVLARRNLSQAAASRLCGLSHTVVSNWTKGDHEPRYADFRALCIGLEVSPSELMGLTRPPDVQREALVAAFDRYIDGVVTPIRVENRALRAALNEARSSGGVTVEPRAGG